MKLSLAVACLLGLVAAEEPVWSLESVQNHRTDSTIQKAYGDHSTDKANARPPYQSTAQVESDSESSDSDSESEEEHANVAIGASKVIEKHPIYNAWESIKDGAVDGKYER